MIKYVIKRLFYAIPVFLGITFTVYLLINLAPGGPLSILAASGEMSLSDLEALKASLGLDKPVLVRYFLWLADLLHGNLGTSYRTSQDVSMMIGQRIIPSLLLTGTGIIGAIIIGIPLGVVSACKPNSIWDHISTFVAFIGASVPNFFLSLLLIYVLAVKMKLFPTSGMYSAGTGGDWKDLLYHLALPAFVCGIQPIGNYIEQIFAWPGIGSLMITAITSRDYPVIMGVAVLICVVVLVVNLILDLIYAALDPRIKFK